MFFLAWCSMMPDDEEIVRWSVLENEIFWDELNNEELIINNEEWDENIQNDDELDNEELIINNEEWDENYEGEDENVEVQI